MVSIAECRCTQGSGEAQLLFAYYGINEYRSNWCIVITPEGIYVYTLRGCLKVMLELNNVRTWAVPSEDGAAGGGGGQSRGGG